MSERGRVLLSWLPAIAYMALIWALSSVALELALVDVVPLRDKGVHFLEYGALGLLVAHAAFRTWPEVPRVRTFFVAVFITVGWGVLDEFHQSFVPGRSADVLDIVADTAGALAGAFARVLASALLSQKRSEESEGSVSS
jgi:VanZ family protein